jgi:hypothetical protein
MLVTKNIFFQKHRSLQSTPNRNTISLAFIHFAGAIKDSTQMQHFDTGQAGHVCCLAAQSYSNSAHVSCQTCTRYICSSIKSLCLFMLHIIVFRIYSTSCQLLYYNLLRLEFLNSKLEIVDSKLEIVDSKLEFLDSKLEFLDSKLDA